MWVAKAPFAIRAKLLIPSQVFFLESVRISDINHFNLMLDLGITPTLERTQTRGCSLGNNPRQSVHTSRPTNPTSHLFDQLQAPGEDLGIRCLGLPSGTRSEIAITVLCAAKGPLP